MEVRESWRAESYGRGFQELQDALRPFSDYAVELLRSLPRVIGCEYVFALALTKDRWRDPRGPFYAGRKAVDLEWVGFHDFRHFRASQWVMRGIDLRTVQELLGHRDITTTMRYAHFAPNHASP